MLPNRVSNPKKKTLNDYKAKYFYFEKIHKGNRPNSISKPFVTRGKFVVAQKIKRKVSKCGCVGTEEEDMALSKS